MEIILFPEKKIYSFENQGTFTAVPFKNLIHYKFFKVLKEKLINFKNFFTVLGIF